MITKRISGQQKQPGNFILQAEPLSRLYHVAESICRIYNKVGASLSPQVKYFTDHSKAVLLLMILYVFVLSCVCYVFLRICLYVLN